MMELLGGEDSLSSVALLKTITEMCGEEANKGGNEELWETIFRSPKPGGPILARPICGGHAVLRLRALRQISPEQRCLLLTPPAHLAGAAPTL